MCKPIMKTKTVYDSLSCSSSSLCSDTSAKKRARVSFGQVETREHQMILDESMTQKPYLTIDWQSFHTEVTPVEEEDELVSKTAKRLEPKDRLVVLLRAGYTAECLREHLSKPSEEDAEPVKKQKKNLFSKMKSLGKKTGFIPRAE